MRFMKRMNIRYLMLLQITCENMKSEIKVPTAYRKGVVSKVVFFTVKSSLTKYCVILNSMSQINFTNIYNHSYI